METVLIKNLKGIALRLQPLDGTGKGIEDLVVALQRIVKGNDGTRSGIAAYIKEHIAPVKVGGVIARHQVPHHYAITAALHEHVMIVKHPAVRRSEQVGLK